LKREKESKKEGWFQGISGKGTTSNLLSVLLLNALYNGSKYEVDTKPTTVTDAISSFSNQQQHTKYTPFTTSSLLDDIGYLSEGSAVPDIIDV